MLCYGDELLSEVDLITLILGTGTKKMDAGKLAEILLNDAGGLRGLARRKGAEVMRVHGIGPAKASRIMATFSLARRLNASRLCPGFKVSSSRDVFLHYNPLLRDTKKEVFIILLLDSKNRLIREERVSEGSLTASIVHPREVFNAAIRESAAAVLAVHNHPSGDPRPSREDHAITVRLKEVGDLVGIRLLDHVIVGEEDYVSFREHRLVVWDQ